MQNRMPYRPGADPATPTRIFGTVTVTVGSLYLTTHSVVVTTIGASAATVISAWTTWLSCSRTPRRPNSGSGINEV
jgi:hypothetical protein